MWIMVAGPYRSGGADAAKRAESLAALNAAALAVHRLGHVPVIGVNMAPPIQTAAGNADAAHEGVVTPFPPALPLASADRRDARLRIGGASEGADAEVARFMAAGRPVIRRVGETPEAVRP